MTTPAALPGATQEALEALDPDRIVLLGGTTAVGDEVEALLGAHAPDVRRVAGATRFGTAADVARLRGTASTVYVATGRAFPDALTAVPAAAADDAPVLMTEPDDVPDETAVVIGELRAKRAVLVGGAAAVSQASRTAGQLLTPPR